MEKKLAEYRARKTKEDTSLKRRLFGLNLFRTEDDTSSQPSTSENGTSDEKQIPQQGKSTYEPWNRIQLTLTALMWIFTWLFCIENQFGAVFFVISIIFFIYYNTRTCAKEKNKLSAYSVFNPNCERIDGTFTSEQFEKELLHGANSVRS